MSLKRNLQPDRRPGGDLMATDVVLIRPNNQDIIYPELDRKGFTGIEVPLWGGLLAATLRKHGVETILLDAQAERWNYATTAREVNALHPALVVLIVSGTNPNASTQNMVGVENLAPMVEPPVALHGLHPSALPQESLAIDGVDYVIQGEGFHSIGTLAKIATHDTGELCIPGVWRKTTPEAKPPQPALCRADALPTPDWTGLDPARYRAHLCMCFGGRERSPYIVTYTSLGCPYGCSFCTINTLFGGPGPIRYRPIKDIQREFEGYARDGITNIKIMDEMFGLRGDRVHEVCEAICEVGGNFNMRAYARVDTVTPQMLDDMKSCGINWIGYGFESGSEEVLREARKGRVLNRNYEAREMTKAAGIHIDANYMFGMEGETDNDRLATFSMMLSHLCEWANINTAMDLPGSRWYRALGRGLRPYTEYAQHTPDSNPPGGEEAVRWRDWAWQAYHTNPMYLQMIERLFGRETRREMESLTKHHLRRNFHE